MSIKSDLNDADKATARRLRRIEKGYRNNYKKSYRQVRNIFAEATAKYEVGGKLTFAEMAKYDRLKKMEIEMQKELTSLYAKDKRLLNNGLTVDYKDSYFRTGYAIEKDIQAKLSYIPIDEARIQAAIQNPIDGLTLDQRFARDRLNIISKTNQEITRSLINGSSYGKTMNNIKKLYGDDAKKAIKIANTETHRINNIGRFEGMKHADDLGVETKKVWVATLDSRTRDAHQSLDGKTVGVQEEFHSSAGGSGLYPGSLGTAADDINCRCTFIIEVAGVKPSFRRARGADGTNEVVPYTTYHDWAAAHKVAEVA